MRGVPSAKMLKRDLKACGIDSPDELGRLVAEREGFEPSVGS
jgi:hypothetical protein